MMGNSEATEVVDYLGKSDPILRKVIKQVGPLKVGKSKEYFSCIIGSIVNQQLSGNVADAIYLRLLSELNGNIDPGSFLKLKDAQFRKSGISRAKQNYIISLSELIKENNDFFKGIENQTDEEVKMKLMGLKGIGEWTANMFLIFALNRQDVLPLGDAGFRRAVSKFYYAGKSITDLDILKISEKWKPYRTTAVRYFWRVVDGTPTGPLQTE